MRALTADEHEYLEGWALVARHTAADMPYFNANGRRPHGTYAGAIVSRSMGPDGPLDGSADIQDWLAGRADAALAAFGLGDTDGANVFSVSDALGTSRVVGDVLYHRDADGRRVFDGFKVRA